MEIRSKCADLENQLEWNSYPKLGEEKIDPTNKAEIVNRWTGRVEGDMKKSFKELPKGKRAQASGFFARITHLKSASS